MLHNLYMTMSPRCTGAMVVFVHLLLMVIMGRNPTGAIETDVLVEGVVRGDALWTAIPSQSSDHQSESQVLCKYLHATDLADSVVSWQLTADDLYCWQVDQVTVNSTSTDNVPVVSVLGLKLSKAETSDVLSHVAYSDITIVSSKKFNKRFIWEMWFENVTGIPYFHGLVEFKSGDGEPIGRRRCLMSSNQLGHWDDNITELMACDKTDVPDLTKSIMLLWKESGHTLIRPSLVDIATSKNLSTMDLVIVSKIVQETINDDETLDPESVRDFLEIIDSFMEYPREILSKAETLDRSASRILTSLEALTLKADMDKQQTLKLERENIAVLVVNTSLLQSPNNTAVGFGDTSTGTGAEELNIQSGDDHLTSLDVDVAILVPIGIIRESSDLGCGRVSFWVYRSQGLFQPSQPGNTVINSRIAAASLCGRPLTNLTEPVIGIYKPLRTNGNPGQPECVFWEFSTGVGGHWSNFGCSLQTSGERFQCVCNHLTNFAVIFRDNKYDNHTTHVLETISLVGLSVSIVALGFTVVTFLASRRLRQSVIQKVLGNLAMALLAANVVFVSGSKQVRDKAGCEVVAALFVYFLLVGFAWMAVEGVIHFLALARSFVTTAQVSAYLGDTLRTAIAIAWGLPVVIVVAAVIVDQSVDMGVFTSSSGYCVPDPYAAYFLLLLPVGLVLLMNLVIYGLVMRRFCCDRSDIYPTAHNQASRMIIMQVRVSLSASVVMGVTWIFGFLSMAETETASVMTYLHCICNPLQGLFVFLLFITRERELRRQLLSALRCGWKSGDTRTSSAHHRTASSNVTDRSDNCNVDRYTQINSSGGHRELAMYVRNPAFAAESHQLDP